MNDMIDEIRRISLKLLKNNRSKSIVYGLASDYVHNELLYIILDTWLSG